MKIIVGLGNPGEKYRDNRHNVGFQTIDELYLNVKEKWQLSDWQVSKKFHGIVAMSTDYILLKPDTYMNDSGKAVAAICRFYKVNFQDLYVIHDDLDIAIGNHKIQFGKGPQIHNGLLSLEQDLGTDQFWNVRIGVENREVRGNKGIPGVEYSLQNFSPEERLIIESVIDSVSRQLAALR